MMSPAKELRFTLVKRISIEFHVWEFQEGIEVWLSDEYIDMISDWSQTSLPINWRYREDEREGL